MITREDLTEARKRYMAGEISHHAYYCWLADSIGLKDTLIPASSERVLASQDESLNDIPLQLWDNQDFMVRQHAYAYRLPWSLCDTVCCLKALAIRRRDWDRKPG
jgi:hypothetical protein